MLSVYGVGCISFAAPLLAANFVLMKAIDTRIIKILVVLASLAYTVYLFATGYWGQGIAMFLLTAVLGLLAWRSIRLILAFWQMRQQKMDKANEWLQKINPKHLWKGQKGYYYFLLGTTEIQSRSLAQSEKNFRQALSHGLRLDHDKAAVYLNLAVIAANRRKKREAVMHLNEAKRFDTKGYLKNDIKQVSKMVNSI
jgi:tetratricopeptide (TPR) repeat protein